MNSEIAPIDFERIKPDSIELSEDCLALLSGVLDGPSQVWAALSTTGLAALVLTPEPAKLVIAPDNDDAGKIAAHKLAERADAMGWKVSLLPPPAHLKDWGEYVGEGVVA